MADVLILAGGSPHAHDFAAIGGALLELVRGSGHEGSLTDDPDAGAADLNDGFDAAILCGLWWRMAGEAYDHWRPDYGYETPEATRHSLRTFVAEGGGLIALHTATICFDDWPEWRTIIGGRWLWGASNHPPYGPVSAEVVADHPVVACLPDTIELHDEVYGDLALQDDIEVLAVAKRGLEDAAQPVIWTHHYRAGRVVYDGFGHDAASIRHPQNARVLRQALRWVTSDDRGACSD
ncbi:MAG: ThuA domain-containing protein [Acidimicrobiales bacterium]